MPLSNAYTVAGVSFVLPFVSLVCLKQGERHLERGWFDRYRIERKGASAQRAGTTRIKDAQTEATRQETAQTETTRKETFPTGMLARLCTAFVVWAFVNRMLRGEYEGRHRLRIVGFVRRGPCAGHHRYHRHHRKHHVPVPREAQALPIRARLPGVLPLLAHGNRHAAHGRRPGERPFSPTRATPPVIRSFACSCGSSSPLRATTTSEAPRVSSASQEGRGRLAPSAERCLAPCPPSDKRGLRTP